MFQMLKNTITLLDLAWQLEWAGALLTISFFIIIIIFLQLLPPSVLDYFRNVVEDAHAPRIKEVCTAVKNG